MEIVIGPRGRRGIMRGVVQSLVGGPQRGDLLVVERRRLADRDALQDQQRRDELAQLPGIEHVGLAQVSGDLLDVRIARAPHTA